MAKIAAYLVVGIAVGLGFAYWQGGGEADDFGSAMSIDERAPIERRLSELETALALERYERQVLAEELAILQESVAVAATESVPSEQAGNPRERLVSLLDSEDPNNPLAERIRQRFPDGVPRNLEEVEQFAEQRQINRFVEAGFTQERAQWLMQREDELQMEVLDARYEASQNGASAEEIANLSTTQLLREELGDADYERYLQGRGRPTSVSVRDVLTNSPAQAAGLQAGDEIVAYNGNRVFEMNELNTLINESGPGETVAIDVVRDGQQMQVYVESGPIGITGGGRSTRRQVETFIGRGGR